MIRVPGTRIGYPVHESGTRVHESGTRVHESGTQPPLEWYPTPKIKSPLIFFVNLAP